MESQWQKSSRSGSNGACLETRYADQVVEVRDSKQPTGPILIFDPTSWAQFVVGLALRPVNSGATSRSEST
ncbi:DUF397 domain-containing protein [Micromonospora maritima]|uniref:DUF397 domain-containing protein n=1 Tax=Micromonospora maritima TaxID=986711 RepID=A0ABW7ZTW8_9ACTN